jgi:PAS domain S-box-containing protein
MSLKSKIWLIIGLVLFTLSGIALSLHFRAIETDARQRMHQQALDLRATLMATRRIYHKQFIESGLPLNDKTLGFLPAHAMSRIAMDFPNWTQSGVRFNNVSDRPRNPANQADADELAAMAWLRENPSAEEYTGTLVDAQGREFFHFAMPIWTEPYCLQCHDVPEAAPPTIRQRYDTGYGYQAGDLRGVMSIRIPVESARIAAVAHWQREVLGLLMLLLALFVSLGWLLNRYLTHRLQPLRVASQRLGEGDYTTRLEGQSKDEIGQLAQGFNDMAAAIEQRERALHDSQRGYRILAENSWSWDYWLGPDGVYRYVSPACESISGHAPAEFLADPGLFERLLHPDDRPLWQMHLKDTLPLPEQYPHAMLNLRMPSPEGDYRWIEHVCRPVFDANGEYLGRRGVNLDMTERKRAEELEHFSAFQAGIAEMSTSVLHNIGNAITAVTQDAETIDHAGSELARVAALLEGNARRCQSELALPEASAPDLASRQCAIQFEAASAINRLSETTLRPRARALSQSVRHIADIVRIQQSASRPNGQLSSFSLSRAIQSALDMQGEAFDKRGIVVKLEVEPGVELVTLPHNRLLQTLINVIRNSIESIDACSQNEDFSPLLQIHAEALDSDRLRITVTDNGAGFDPQIKADLFHFGFSTKQRGSGFGLHSVAVFAQEVGGSVVLESAGPGQGACLVLELPLSSRR